MTYQKLIEQLQKLSPEQLEKTVTVHRFNKDEFIPAKLEIEPEENFPVIVIE